LCFDELPVLFFIQGKEIDGDTLKQVAKSVCGIELTDRVVKILFTIFDEDGNGTLTHK
jgi:Ca2+-binding EF-hand superfamily protein